MFQTVADDKSNVVKNENTLNESSSLEISTDSIPEGKEELPNVKDNIGIVIQGIAECNTLFTDQQLGHCTLTSATFNSFKKGNQFKGKIDS